MKQTIVQQWKVRAAALVCILSFLPCLTLPGQQAASTSAGASRTDVAASQDIYRSDAVILVHSDLVLIPVCVTGEGGRAVSGLRKEHFHLFEDAAPQEIIHFDAEDVPVSIGIVFDASGSMASKLPKAREAVNTLLNNANPEDEFFFVRFSTEARVTVAMTKRSEDIREQMGALRTSGTTALLDGVRIAMAEMQHAHNSRKAIIIISDGEDNASRWTTDELKAAVRAQDIVIYAIGIDDSPDGCVSHERGQHCGAALLHDIANQTGGRLFEVNRVKQLPGIAAQIGGWLRNQYVLGYVPSRSDRNGMYRSVKLMVSRPAGYPRLHAVWRQGYYAPKE